MSNCLYIIFVGKGHYFWFGYDKVHCDNSHGRNHVKIIYSICLKSTEHTLSVILSFAICFRTLTSNTLKIHPTRHTYSVEELSPMMIMLAGSKEISYSHVNTVLEKITSTCFPLFSQNMGIFWNDKYILNWTQINWLFGDFFSWDLNSPIRNQTHNSCSGSAKS